MKTTILKQKLLIFLALLFAFNLTLAQEIEPQFNNSQQEDFNFYMGQHKKLKKTGYLLLGIGGGLIVGGVAVIAASDTWDNVGGGALMISFGSLTSIASVPVFIVSGSKKRKAKTYLEGGVSSMTNPSLNYSKHAAISLKIDF